MTPPQHMDALASANAERGRRAEVRKALRGCPDGQTARTALVFLIADPPPEAFKMTIFEVIVAAHRFGRARASRVLRRAGLRENLLLGQLTNRQRGALIDSLLAR